MASEKGGERGRKVVKSDRKERLAAKDLSGFDYLKNWGGF